MSIEDKIATVVLWLGLVGKAHEEDLIPFLQRIFTERKSMFYRLSFFLLAFLVFFCSVQGMNNQPNDEQINEVFERDHILKKLINMLPNKQKAVEFIKTYITKFREINPESLELALSTLLFTGFTIHSYIYQNPEDFDDKLVINSIAFIDYLCLLACKDRFLMPWIQGYLHNQR